MRWRESSAAVREGSTAPGSFTPSFERNGSGASTKAPGHGSQQNPMGAVVHVDRLDGVGESLACYRAAVVDRDEVPILVSDPWEIGRSGLECPQRRRCVNASEADEARNQ